MGGQDEEGRGLAARAGVPAGSGDVPSDSRASETWWWKYPFLDISAASSSKESLYSRSSSEVGRGLFSGHSWRRAISRWSFRRSPRRISRASKSLSATVKNWNKQLHTKTQEQGSQGKAERHFQYPKSSE
jgi:hypothetical protein